MRRSSRIANKATEPEPAPVVPVKKPKRVAKPKKVEETEPDDESNKKAPAIFYTVADEVSKPAFNKFPTRKVIVDNADDIWGSDLVQMTTYADENDGYSYMLNVIDLFTRYAWSVPIKTKSAKDMLDGFEKIVKMNNGKTPKHLWTDEGSEYYNKTIKDWLDKHGTTIYSTHGKHKSAVIERFNRTIKTMMWKQFIPERSHNWIKLLPELLESYNNKKHKSIGMTPKEARALDDEGMQTLREKQYGNLPSQNASKPKFEVGNFVRISRIKNTFEKGYEPKWTYEFFKVAKVLPTVPYTYHLVDLHKEPVKGSFYEQELQLTKQKPDDEYLIDKVLDERDKVVTKKVKVRGKYVDKEVKVPGKKEVYVRFLGFPPSFDMWIDKDLVSS